MKTILDDAIQASEQQHAVTRDHITTAMQDLKTSQHDKDRRHYSQQQRERFIESLAYDGINARQNDISETHPTTFEWMFDEDLETTRDVFQVWLKDEEAVFWINGKAGSGKSTLMKFLANHSKTRQLLAQRTEKKVVIVSHFFWLAGSSMQKSLKGLLCSLVYQILQGDPTILDRIRLSGSKRYFSDWSEPELQDLFRTVVNNLSCSCCIFLDGLDEFNEVDEIERLLDLLEKVAANNRLKFCLSSRPEIAIERRLSRYKQVRLQDLTHNDMKHYIQDKLQEFHYRYTSTDEEKLERIVEAMTQKADGVFLWVHYVLSSVLRGMRNADNPSVLLQRIEDSPSAMKELYNQMWKRHNGDEQRYRDEAAQLFSCVANFSLSVFEMLVVLDKELQDGYSQGLTRNDAVNLAELCERLKTRILTRCAGLLEFRLTNDPHKNFAPYPRRNETPSSTAMNTPQDISEVTEIQRWLSDPKEQIDEGRKANSPLMIHGQTSIHFLHRTARDYVLNTKEGRGLLGDTTSALASKSHHVAVARLATVSQGFGPLKVEAIHRAMETITESDSKRKAGLMRTLKQVCERRSVPQCPLQHIGHRAFWGRHTCVTFEASAAWFGCVDYIRDYVERHGRDVSPVHRGFLMYSAFYGFWGAFSPQNLALIVWLASKGTDIISSISYRELVTNVASLILGPMAYSCSLLRNSGLIGPIAGVVESLRPLLVVPEGQCEVWLPLKSTEKGLYDRIWFVQMSPLCLYSLVMRIITRQHPGNTHHR